MQLSEKKSVRCVKMHTGIFYATITTLTVIIAVKLIF